MWWTRTNYCKLTRGMLHSLVSAHSAQADRILQKKVAQAPAFGGGLCFLHTARAQLGKVEQKTQTGRSPAKAGRGGPEALSHLSASRQMTLVTVGLRFYTLPKRSFGGHVKGGLKKLSSG